MTGIVIGMGEIGKAVYSVYSEYHDLDTYDLRKIFSDINLDNYDVMLVCIPYSDVFCAMVEQYKEKFNPKAVIVFSTVQIGTCQRIGAIHCPIEGRHPNLRESIFAWDVVMGGFNAIAYNFFTEAGKRPEMIYDSPRTTEALKLLSTTFYGLCIEFYRYATGVLNQTGVDGEAFTLYNESYNRLYEALDMEEFFRPLLYPPDGKIGGHCVLGNCDILQESYPNELVKYIIERNKNL